jgi:hypothetical protein
MDCGDGAWRTDSELDGGSQAEPAGSSVRAIQGIITVNVGLLCAGGVIDQLWK